MTTEEDGALAGTVLAKTYKLERLLAEGGMGAVYQGLHLRTGGLCAVKVLHQQSAANSDIYERFLAEAQIISMLRHPHIVHVSDLNSDDPSMPFLVMELLEGEDLESRLQRVGKLPLPVVLNLAREVGSAMQAAHNRGVVHRDLKPRNIFLARYEVGGRSLETTKVIDFGVSKIPRPAARATRNQLVLGTPRYVAPEGALGQNSEIDGRADQFSLAVILYRALAGRVPFDSDNVVELLRQIVVDTPPLLSELVPGLPRHVEGAIARAMEKSKLARFSTIMEFVTALESAPGRPPTMRVGAVSDDSQVHSGEQVVALDSASRASPPGPALVAPAQQQSDPAQPVAPVSSPGLPRASVVLSQTAVKHIAAQRARAEEHTLAPPIGPVAEHVTLSARPLDWRRIALSALAGALVCTLAYVGVSRFGGHRVSGATHPTTVATTGAPLTRTPAPEPGQPGEAAPPGWERFERAVARNDADEAMKALRDIPSDSPYATRAKLRYQELFRWFAALHLQQAEAARSAAQCPKAQEEVQRVLDLEPLHREALMARWRHCGVTFFAAAARDPYKPLGYPPLRPFLGMESQGPRSAALVGEMLSPPGDDQLLRDAQLAHAQQRYQRAMELAHGVVGGDPQNASMAWRLLAVSACGLKRPDQAGMAYDRLDATSREFVRAQCQRLGLSGFR